MAKTIIATHNAPSAIGTYSQAVRVGDTVYMSGQIGLDPATMQMVDGIDAQIVRVFENLKAVAEAAGGTLAGELAASGLAVLLLELTTAARARASLVLRGAAEAFAGCPLSDAEWQQATLPSWLGGAGLGIVTDTAAAARYAATW